MALLLLNTTGHNTLHAAVLLQYKEWKRILQYTLTNTHRVLLYQRILIVTVMLCFEREPTHDIHIVAYPGILFRGVQQIQLRTEDGENGDLGVVAT